MSRRVLRLFYESESEVAQSCTTLSDPMGCSLPGSSIHGIFQARVLEWVAISFSRGSSRPRDRTWVSRIVGRRFTIRATWEAQVFLGDILRSLGAECCCDCTGGGFDCWAEKSGATGHPWLAPDLKGKDFKLSPLSVMFTVGLSHVSYRADICSFYA